VDDQMAAYLVVKTLALRREGQGTTAALRGAQISVLEDAGGALPAQFAHPFYWAAFAVIGEGGPASAVSLAGASRL
jgi:CHAT domain-containing protein